MRKLLALISALALSFTAVGCGSNACEDAVDKVVACVNGLDCAGEAMCETMKQQLKAAADAYGGQDCTGQAETWANQVNSCTLDKQTCDCQ